MDISAYELEENAPTPRLQNANFLLCSARLDYFDFRVFPTWPDDYKDEETMEWLHEDPDLDSCCLVCSSLAASSTEGLSGGGGGGGREMSFAF